MQATIATGSILGSATAGNNTGSDSNILKNASTTDLAMVPETQLGQINNNTTLLILQDIQIVMLDIPGNIIWLAESKNKQNKNFAASFHNAIGIAALNNNAVALVSIGIELTFKKD